jgi:adenylate kinase family enzyme
MPDCKTNGWILMGAPSSIDQINMLKEFDQQPSIFISLDKSEHLIYENLEQRRFDPVTNKYHYIFNENLTDEVILNRLEHNVEDHHPYIKKKLIEYRAFLNLILGEYSGQLVRINAEQPEKDIYRNFIEAIEHSF